MTLEDRAHRIRVRRAYWFARVVRRLDLVSFADLADWCARKPGSVHRDEALREQTYRDLEHSVGQGEFGPPDKPFVAFLPKTPDGEHVGRFPLRLTAGQIFDLGSAPHLWAPRSACVRWLSSRQISLPPWLIGTAELKWRSPQIPSAAVVSEVLARAADDDIDAAISAEYSDAEARKAKPPNVKELVKPVRLRLSKLGKIATHQRVMTRADLQKFKQLRRRPGATLKNELRSATLSGTKNRRQ
jgi:hypothetical protein